MKFLVDNQLPPALARFISRELQTEAMHVIDVGLRESNDADVWAYASLNELVLISKDDDFSIRGGQGTVFKARSPSRVAHRQQALARVHNELRQAVERTIFRNSRS